MAVTNRTGGDPIVNVTELVLCGRSDLGAQRFFDGRIAHLAVYDEAINSATVWPSNPSWCTAGLGTVQGWQQHWQAGRQPVACNRVWHSLSSLSALQPWHLGSFWAQRARAIRIPAGVHALATPSQPAEPCMAALFDALPAGS